MKFEFDPAKSVANQQKHGIDFEAAQALWQDARRVEIPARIQAEPRRMLVAKCTAKLWTAIFTKREDNIREISVRGGSGN